MVVIGNNNLITKNAKLENFLKEKKQREENARSKKRRVMTVNDGSLQVDEPLRTRKEVLTNWGQYVGCSFLKQENVLKKVVGKRIGGGKKTGGGASVGRGQEPGTVQSAPGSMGKVGKLRPQCFQDAEPEVKDVELQKKKGRTAGHILAVLKTRNTLGFTSRQSTECFKENN